MTNQIEADKAISMYNAYSMAETIYKSMLPNRGVER